ncbi:MAG: cation-translocating P-type ATPase [Spirulina sp.]
MVSSLHPVSAPSWYGQDGDRVLANFHSSAAGLSTETAEEALQCHGPNVLPEVPPRSQWAIWVAQFRSLPVALLTVAAAIAYFTGGPTDALVILGVVLINGVIGYATESQSDRIIRSLDHLSSPTAWVRRNGERVELEVAAVVPGDILVLRPGSMVVADGRLIEAQSLSVDESALTGESLPVGKAIDPLPLPNLPLADRTNMVYRGTLVTGGQGLAVVVATGATTEMGQIQALVGQSSHPPTPMEQQLDRAGSQLVWISSAVCAVVFGLGLWRGYAPLEMLTTAVALAVAAVPEGLPAVATTTLALGILAMRRQRVLIRRLDAVETLGSLQTLCLDKTGTLTANRMAVVEIHTDHTHLTLADGASPLPEGIPPGPLHTLLRMVVLCNESKVADPKETDPQPDPDSKPESNSFALGISGRGDLYPTVGRPGNPKPQPTFTGSSTENALLAVAHQAGIDIPALRQTYPQLAIQHRSAQRNVMATLHTTPTGNWLVAVKGSPLELLAQCEVMLDSPNAPGLTADVLTADRSLDIPVTQDTDDDWTREATTHWLPNLADPIAITPDQRQAIVAENERMAQAGLRVLGVAYGYPSKQDNLQKETPHQDSLKDNWTETPLVWLGLVAMADPLRPGVTETIAAFHRAGIDTVMVTGDQRATAAALGQALNLSQGEPLAVLESADLMALSPTEAQGQSQGVQVFARISPADKLQVVQALQRSGKVVAMTGDGINDTPALKVAEVGIAMGHSGTDAAREVADVILQDDNLDTLIEAIAQGRTIYNNIRKAVHFLLATNLSEIMVMFAGISLGLGAPLNALQLLWLNLVTDIFPGLALALEPPTPEVLTQPPRPTTETLIKPAAFRRMVWEAAVISASALGAYGYAIHAYGIGAQASTVGFMALTLAQLLHALVCRSRQRHLFRRPALAPNRYLGFALILSITLQFLALFIQPLGQLLHIVSLCPVDAVVVTLAALLPVVINETTKNWDSPSPSVVVNEDGLPSV